VKKKKVMKFYSLYLQEIRFPSSDFVFCFPTFSPAQIFEQLNWANFVTKFLFLLQSHNFAEVTINLWFFFSRKSSETIISQTSLPIGRFRASPSEGKDGAIPPEEHGLLDTKTDN
jgi:hypothetical protein